MENTNVPTDAGQPLSTEQVASIAGGADDTSCTASATVNTGVGTVTSSGPTPSDALISIYEGFVDVTSHIIERVMGN